MAETSQSPQGKFLLEYVKKINYAMLHGGVPAMRYARLENLSPEGWKDITVSLQGDMLEESSCLLQWVPAGGCIEIKDLVLKPVLTELAALTEGITVGFSVRATTAEGLTLAEERGEVRLLAFDEWPGIGVMPELLSSFVTPNEPALRHVISQASAILKSLTGDSAFDGYQSQDANRVRSQVAALYEALRQEGISYVTPPASFERQGQRVRLSSEVLSQKLGTCLDLALLLSSVGEAVGLHPLLVLLKDHAFMGFWLVDQQYNRSTGDDASYLLKSSANGVSELVFLEATALTTGRNTPFETAVAQAEAHLQDGQNMELFIDVARCRAEGVHPLPTLKFEHGRWTESQPGLQHEQDPLEVKHLEQISVDVTEEERRPLTRQQMWERKLLDFSLRNNLVNLKMGRRVVPFVSFAIDQLEDRLQDGCDYEIEACPDKKAPNDQIYNSTLYREEMERLVIDELGRGKIISYMTQAELATQLKYIYRTARTSMEENGANSLFLVLGVLKWYETERSQQQRYAPILLLPVDIVRKGVGKYVLRRRDEDLIINTTIIELLKQQFGLNITGLSPLPTDEHGVNVRKVFTIIRTHIREKQRWDIQEESLLGLFSFNKFVMWNDIHNNASRLKENKIIDSLIEKRVTWEEQSTDAADARELDRLSPPRDFVVPLDVDSSQLEAVVESGRGRSFILYGPPGTGKSQTITNMIANALYQGKRVLFVAEKMAALSVVQKRLTKIGLAPFCLEMHSNKATKSHFLGQLGAALEVAHLKEPSEYAEASDRLFAKRQELMAYIDKLHEVKSSGLSLYDCISGFLSSGESELRLPEDMVTTLTRKQLETWVEMIEELDAVFQVTGRPGEHPLKGLLLKEASEEALSKVGLQIERLRSLLSSTESNQNSLRAALGVDPSQTVGGMAWVREMARALSSMDSCGKALLSLAGNEKRAAEWTDVAQQGVRLTELRRQMLVENQEKLLDEDGAALQQKWQGAQQKWFLPRYFGKRGVVKQLRKYQPSLTEDKVSALLEQLVEYQTLERANQPYLQEAAELFGPAAKKQQRADWETINQTLEGAKTLMQLLYAESHAKNSPVSSLMAAVDQAVGPDWDSFRQDHGQLLLESSRLEQEWNQALDELRPLAELEPLSEGGTSIAQLAALLSTWKEHLAQGRDWTTWCQRKQQLEKERLQDVVKNLEQGWTAQNAAQALKKGACRQLAMRIIDSDEKLQLFNGLLFEDQIRRYRELARQFQELSKKELFARLASHVPNSNFEAAAGSELGIVKRNIKSGGRGTSIRQIVEQIPTLLPRLCPCMLMSPLSVAQYIDLNNEPFDLIIFDEASQMPTSEAVGAIGRGKALIVVGDPKQMPPTSFFSSTQTDEEEADVDDMESILDDCITLSMPARYLTWHYRSKHESLIAFSNTQYYDGQLYTFPSVDDRASKVRLVRVEGTYDFGGKRTNRAEAQAIVDDVIRRLQDKREEGKSIGIVSFSKVQQDLIEDLLLEELSKHPELEEKALHGEEPLFVKNLENVQGDERDVILFSVGYGPDKTGRVSMNFGPLNQEGGERRLNVAVSRARYEMVVFSTLRAEQIDLNRSKAKGVEGLKRFLEYAASGHAVVSASQVQAPEPNAVAIAIAERLKIHGYEVDTSVGRSRFRVDLAVRSKEEDGDYLLGILTDGEGYCETKTERDREIVQPSVLQMLKWNIVKVWSVDWMLHPADVEARILKALELVKAGQPLDQPEEKAVKAAAPLKAPEKELKEDEVVPTPEFQRPYVAAQIKPFTGNYDVEKMLARP
ncbi:MAG: DUF4011 domain-containing protein, partial [Bacteroidaceae bacterium]|nr:DUF4011 domain-containing protein [Bacteroidaceae bacterium]